MNRNIAIVLLSGVLGVLILQNQPSLPVSPIGSSLYPVLCVVLYFCARNVGSRTARLICLILLGGVAGFGWAAWRAELRLAQELDPDWQGRDIQIVGEVAGLPQSLEGGTRFPFRVRGVETEDAVVPEYLLLSAYARGVKEKDGYSNLQTLKPGEYWRLQVRLKRPHGNMNPGGFDYEAWLLEQNIRATGYVRFDIRPERLGDHWAWPPMNTVHRIRYGIREAVGEKLAGKPYGGILTALIMGDQRAIDDRLWKIFNRTGTIHLMSISGLHITLVAGLCGWLVNFLWRRSTRLCLFMPAQQIALLAAWVTALSYGLLAGFGIPTQRTCFMLTVAVLALLSGRRISTAAILLWSVVGVVLLDPWAVLAPGFWLSFGAVAALVWISQHSLPPGQGWRGHTVNFMRTQWAATLATLPILLWIFQQFPLVSPLANLIAIPLVSFVITPLALLGGILVWVPGLPLLTLAHGLLDGLMWFLEWLALAPLWQPPVAALWALGLSIISVFLLLMPRGAPGKGVALVLLLPLVFWPRISPEPGSLSVSVLDVGQGQAVLFETAHHVLLYDTGPRIGSDDAGKRIIIPFMERLGIGELDMLVVSHRDLDHAGGLASILAGVEVKKLLSSIPGEGEPCTQGTAWEWDGIFFEFLHPEPGKILKGDNRDSCVMRVSTPAGRILLTGDAGVREEKAMLLRDPAGLAAEVVLVPHHGSKTSSSPAFVKAVGADLALISAGYRNRYQHPRPEVVARYEAAGSEVLRTDRDGALLLHFAEKKINIVSWRQSARRYWWGR